MKTKSGLTLALALLAAAGMATSPIQEGIDFGFLPKSKTRKERKPKRVYSPEDQAELDRLFLDRSSPGRKKYNAFKRGLNGKTNKG